MLKLQAFTRVALNNQSGQILLIYNVKHSNFNFPGGKIEPGESAEQCAIRELYEEIGISTSTLRYIFDTNIIYDEKWIAHGYFYRSILDAEVITLKEPEKVSDSKWVNYDDLTTLQNLSPDVKTWIEHIK